MYHLYARDGVYHLYAGDGVIRYIDSFDTAREAERAAWQRDDYTVWIEDDAGNILWSNEDL